MRKLIFTILIAAGCLQAAAERTVPFFDTSRPDKVIALGLRAGMNSSGVATNYMDKQPELIQSNFLLALRRASWRHRRPKHPKVSCHRGGLVLGTTRIRRGDDGCDCRGGLYGKPVHARALQRYPHTGAYVVAFQHSATGCMVGRLRSVFQLRLSGTKKPTPTLHSARRTDNWCLTTTSAIKNISKPTRKTSLPSTASTPA